MALDADNTFCYLLPHSHATVITLRDTSLCVVSVGGKLSAIEIWFSNWNFPLRNIFCNQQSSKNLNLRENILL